MIADEPYRELVYGNIIVPYLMNYYKNTLVCYSYSKSLSLPGERIGYIAVSPEMVDAKNVYLAVCGAGRTLGYVCAPSLFQRVVLKCIDAKVNIKAYEENRNLLYNSLVEYGYDCVKPDGEGIPAEEITSQALEEAAEALLANEDVLRAQIRTKTTLLRERSAEDARQAAAMLGK